MEWQGKGWKDGCNSAKQFKLINKKIIQGQCRTYFITTPVQVTLEPSRVYLNLNIEEMSDVFSRTLNSNLIPLSECKPPELRIKRLGPPAGGSR